MNSYPSGKTALVLVDPFNDFLSEGGKLWSFTKETVEGTGMIENLKSLITAVRRSGMQIIYAPHHHTTEGDYMNWKFLAPSHEGSKKTMLFEKDSWGGQFHPELQPGAGDLVAQNHWTGSGFANTDLDFLLRLHGIEYVILAGMRANTCIDTTARYAVELGYHVTLIRDGIASFTWEEIKATVETNFPNYGHVLLTTEEFTKTINS